ncbi:MAG TPA: pilus assembly protein N-terminal domain-containing protein [Rhizomicrobium sp.]|nr:pilus assembly protein N-terminal domain-containing protein [Rhizomicrobium sp.]
MRLRSVLLVAASFAFAAGSACGATKAPPHHKAAPHKRTVAHHAAPRTGGGVSVVMDQVRIVTFNRPVATVFVGNPTIADATVIDPYHAFVLGKTFGVTNLIALSAQSQTIANQQITVSNRSGGVVTLNKGANQFSYACTSAHCETNPIPGDQKTYVEDTQGTVSTHQDQALKAAVATAQR